MWFLILLSVDLFLITLGNGSSQLNIILGPFHLECSLPAHQWVAFGVVFPFLLIRTSLVAQTIKCLSTMWETWVQSLGWEDPLEKEMAIHSSTIAWKIPWTEEPGRLQSMGSQRVGHDWATSLFTFPFLLSQPGSTPEASLTLLTGTILIPYDPPPHLPPHL